MKQRLYILKYECNEATAMLQRLYIVNYECNEATVLLHRLDKKKTNKAQVQFKQAPSSSQQSGQRPDSSEQHSYLYIFASQFLHGFSRAFFSFSLAILSLHQRFSIYRGVLGVLDGVGEAKGGVWYYFTFNFLKFQEVTNQILDVFKLT